MRKFLLHENNRYLSIYIYIYMYIHISRWCIDIRNMIQTICVCVSLIFIMSFFITVSV